MATEQVDEWAIRDTAKHLADLYRELDAAKHQGTVHREARVTRPRPGPQAPGNLLIISLDRDLVSRLHEYARDAANHIQPAKIITWDGAELCRWIAWHASAIAELDFATDMLDEMVDQARKINRRLHPPEPATIARAPEKYIDIEAIVRNLHQRGHHVTPRQAREVAVYNKFDLCKFTDGRNGYRLTDFLDHYTR